MTDLHSSSSFRHQSDSGHLVDNLLQHRIFSWLTYSGMSRMSWLPQQSAPENHRNVMNSYYLQYLSKPVISIERSGRGQDERFRARSGRKVRSRSGTPGHVRTCPSRGRCRQAPETGRQPSQPIRSRHEALAVQSGTDTEPLDTNHR